MIPARKPNDRLPAPLPGFPSRMPVHSKRVALFGGSFDPIHHGHLAIAGAAVRQASLDQVIFLPAARSPFKDRGPVADGELRMAMLKAAAAGLPWASASGWELPRPVPSYSWQAAEHFTREVDPRAEWFWLMGADQWQALGRWNRWEHLAGMVTFLIFGRDGQQPPPRPGVRARFLNGEFTGSSTEIRSRLACGQGIAGLVPPAVERIILESGVYGPAGSPSREAGAD
ncbi:MAG: nicotinate (nicotinamide) nucleotide adenylyltransferase [Verrucomicrobiales bacterium]|nr:nicotinate (nicotinamide) nucleotide adenylyltransferase [Verrucomicrobiales bacterium]